MTDIAFAYENGMLESCAASNLVAHVLCKHQPTLGAIRAAPTHASGDESCTRLFQQFSAHYDREWDAYTDAFTQDESGNYAHVGRRLSRFLSTVAMVYNQESSLRVQQRRHLIGLNQFADSDDVLPWMTSEDDWNRLWEADDWETKPIPELEGLVVSRLHDDRSIHKAAAGWSVKKSREDHNDEASLGPRRNQLSSLRAGDDRSFSTDQNVVSENQTAFSTSNSSILMNEQNFDTYLNWATSDNPDGVPIVHAVSDQGACGSCWAFSATGTLEASAVRRIAFQTYTKHIQASLHEEDDAVRDESVTIAQATEKESIEVADLSVQELVDCDTYADQGCTGGNPLLAFYFIHRFGLTATGMYPYVGEQRLCKVERVSKPIATVESWGILTPNHEDNMELVLRYIGPVAVGVNGADPEFLAYHGGVFDSPDCDQAANHALLIVGYGQELKDDGAVVRYWIARNSWGKGWGENGYVRVKRGEGSKGAPGICGIARSPSVALGGTLLPQSGTRSTDTHVDMPDKPQWLETSLVYSCCQFMGLDSVPSCHRMEGLLKRHQTTVYCSISLLICAILVLFPLTKDCRSRRRRQLSLRQRMEGMSCLRATEDAPLLHHGDMTTAYGSMPAGSLNL